MNANEHKELIAFLRESNKIEGIYEVRSDEWDEAIKFLANDVITVSDLSDYVKVTANAKLRNVPGRDITIGNHTPHPGGPHLVKVLMQLLDAIEDKTLTPWEAHCEYETIHPYTDGNGRSGRLLWAWQMLSEKRWPGIGLGFLHAFYYQTLERGQK